jgi:hypothetical protein
MNILNLNEALALFLCRLGSLVNDDILLLISLTTTQGEVGLPTSTAQHGGLHEVGARGGSLGLGSRDPFSTKHTCGDRRLHTHLGMMFSGRRPLGWLRAKPPSMSRGRCRRKYVTLRFCIHVLALAKPPSKLRVRVCDMREEKVGLDT